MNAHDFLSLISGATLNEVKDRLSSKRLPGRVKCLEAAGQKLAGKSPFLFDRDNEKNFLEVLYLKLSFLGELAGMIFSDRVSLSHPGFSYSLERIWVKLADQAGLLPHFWNFSLDVIDIGVNPVEPPQLSEYPSAHILHFLGNAWFYALLVNHGQPVEQVRAGLEKFMVASTSAETGLSEWIKKQEPNPVFAPENIFWRPEDRHVNEDWHRVWEKSLDLGGGLLVAGTNRGSSWSQNEFWQNFETLREQIKTELFGRGSLASGEQFQSDDPAISVLLNEILVRWRSKMKAPNDRQATEEVAATLEKSVTTQRVLESRKETTNEKEEPAETVILRPNASAEKKSYTPKLEDSEETLVLSPEEHPGSSTAENTLQDEEEIQETMILEPDDYKNKRPPSEPINAAAAENDMPATVILSPGQKTAGRADVSRQKDLAENFLKQDEASISAQDQGRVEKARQEKKKDAPEDEDLLTETVVLRTDKAKDKGSADE